MDEECPDIRRDLATECGKQAWFHAARGDAVAAHSLYRAADELWTDGEMNPGLSLMRHMKGSASGLVTPLPFTEDDVASFAISHDCGWRPTAESEALSYRVDDATLEGNIAALVAYFSRMLPETHHAKNISQHLPHVQVLSTGRCGTVSLYRMLQGSNVQPYHNYWWMLQANHCWEAAYAALAGMSFDPRPWLETRAAEWLGCISQNRAMVAINHMDTAFAPIFAAIHPKSRFVYLRRDPLAVFTSFYAKGQWLNNQLRPLRVAFDPFRYQETDNDEVECLAWFIHFTEVFSRAFGRVLGDRWVEISADKLFQRDNEEIACLLDHCGARVNDPHASLAKAKNVKAHKVVRSEEEVAAGQERFLTALARLDATGTL